VDGSFFGHGFIGCFMPGLRSGRGLFRRGGGRWGFAGVEAEMLSNSVQNVVFERTGVSEFLGKAQFGEDL
jgi:hypothetical protein